MPREVKVEHVLKFGELVGKGPLKTEVFQGTYGKAAGILESSKKRNNTRDVLIKVIKSRVISPGVDWENLQLLDHPNVAKYILVHECGLFNTVTYVVQDLHTNTLVQLAEWTGDMAGAALKRAVRDISSGLQYLHNSTPTPLFHKNLKPSNVLVKCPLTNPSGFVLTDYWYSDVRSVANKSPMICSLMSKSNQGKQELTGWMAPELVADIFTPPTVMMDMYSFGMTLKFVLSSLSELPFDEVDELLFQQMVEEMIEEDASFRITCDSINRHPLLTINPRWDEGGNATARLHYINKSYNKIMKMNEDLSKNVCEQVEKVVHLLASEVFPWAGESVQDSFCRRIYAKMSQKSDTPYDADSFVDLLRLISESRVTEENHLGILCQEISDDAFSKSFPFIIPLLYICMSTLDPLKKKSDEKYKSHRYSIGSVNYPSIDRKNRRKKT